MCTRVVTGSYVYYDQIHIVAVPCTYSCSLYTLFTALPVPLPPPRARAAGAPSRSQLTSRLMADTTRTFDIDINAKPSHNFVSIAYCRIRT